MYVPPQIPPKKLILTNTKQEYKQALGDKFSLITAFSREGASKVYVQHRLQEQAKEVNELLQQKAYFYVCGDAANMAREVNQVLVKIIAEQRGMPEAKAEEIVKSMRSANQYQVCSFSLFIHLFHPAFCILYLDVNTC
jgi:sulfite reductase alpha subunit-like flavoprotein